MSRKPPKKSDMGKAWMKPRRDLQQMISPEYHLIVSEGKNTEPLYFQSLKDIVEKRYRDRIHLDISGKGDNTLSLFNRAITDVRLSNNVYKHVWLVYDKDDFPAEHFDQTADLCESHSTNETSFHAIWSNQCIELWFLLHFMNGRASTGFSRPPAPRSPASPPALPSSSRRAPEGASALPPPYPFRHPRCQM